MALHVAGLLAAGRGGGDGILRSSVHFAGLHQLDLA
jgi:hypothetical protein